MDETKNKDYTPDTEEKKSDDLTEEAVQQDEKNEAVTSSAENDGEDYEEDYDDDDDEPKSKANIVFGVICTVLCVAIGISSVLSIFNIKNYTDTSTEVPAVTQQTENRGFNIYTQMYPKYKDTKYPANMAANFNRLYAANNDVAGWLYIPGTNVNTPVVQAKDNSKYLRNNFYGSNTNYGTTYIDYRCNKGNTLSTNTVIYGHNMPSGTHFYDVHRYENIEWYKTHPTIQYNTLYGSYTFLVSSVFYTTASRKFDGGYLFDYIYPNMGQKSMSGYIQQVTQRSIYSTGIDISPTDKVITLSTCTHSLDGACGTDIDGRLVVVGRLLRYGESADVDTSKAKENPNYRRPQIWYDKKGKTNPYAQYVTWTPSQQ